MKKRLYHNLAHLIQLHDFMRSWKKEYGVIPSSNILVKAEFGKYRSDIFYKFRRMAELRMVRIARDGHGRLIPGGIQLLPLTKAHPEIQKLVKENGHG